jgi:hypothetical protein
MAGVYPALRAFVVAHRKCVRPRRAGASLPTPSGYSVRVKCGCGRGFTHWVTLEAPDQDLLRSALVAFENWCFSPSLDRSLRLLPLCLRHVLPDQQTRRGPVRCPGIVEPVEPYHALWREVFLRIRIDVLVRRNRVTAQRALFTTNSGADLRLEGSPRWRARNQAAVVKQQRAAGLQMEPIRPCFAHRTECSQEDQRRLSPSSSSRGTALSLEPASRAARPSERAADGAC